jgi:hypothetical protein
MSLHDWNVTRGWSGVHTLWMTELLRWVKPRLPPGFRANLGNAPTVTVDLPDDNEPDMAVRAFPDEPPTVAPTAEPTEPDIEVATLTLDPQISLFVTWEGRLIAAVELISPRNKDRPSARAHYTARYAGYLMGSAHLLLIDVHPRPARFSFADRIAAELEIPGFRPLATPHAIAYRVGEPAAAGGRMVGIWRRPLAVGQPLPTIPLPITLEADVIVDLDQTYARAAADAYLS